MKEMKMYETFCTGCGLCHSAQNVNYYIDDKGFFKPLLKDSDLSFCSKICPASGIDYNKKSTLIWGDCTSVIYAYSSNENIRKNASSGGVLTTLAIFLLENKLIDGVLQIKVKDDDQLHNFLTFNTSKEEIIECCGSRYNISNPLISILQIIDYSKKYLFIGKPCDVFALKNYLNIHVELKEVFRYMFTFFCAGIPSMRANMNLLKIIGVDSSNIKKIIYRGNGWPGLTTIVDKNDNIKTMPYVESWGKILGRDVNKYCRFCTDGMGEMADISCGDAWYLNTDKSPDFSEHDGRNVVVIRNSKGNEIVQNAIRQGYIIKEPIATSEILSEMKNIQQYQYIRKATLYSRFLAMKICRKATPIYSRRIIRKWAKNECFVQQLRFFLGTFKRILQKKL